MDAAHDIREAGLGPHPDAVGDVLVLRPGGLGHVVKAVPALRHLRGVYPEARISVAAGSSTLELLRACPYVDRCIDASRPARLLLERFDVAISFGEPASDGTMLGGALPALSAITSDVHVAWRSEQEQPTLAIHPVWPRRLADAHRMLHLVWLLGGGRPEADLGLWPTLADRNGAARLVHGLDKPIAIVHPGAGLGNRQWPAERFAGAVDLLSSLGVHPVVIGLERDRTIVDVLHEQTRGSWSDLVGRTPVGVLVGLMERASLFVGNDSGPAVLAGALGLHAVVIGPRSAVEQLGPGAHAAYVSGDPWASERCDATGVAPLDAASVDAETVLGRIALAACHARGRWRHQHVRRPAR